MNIISVQHLSKTIHGHPILNDISFDVLEGDCLAIIGPNGAGKTTLIDCLLGDKFASAGHIRIKNLPPTHKQLKNCVAILPQENTVVESLTVGELIHFFQQIYPDPLSQEEIDDLLGFSPQQKQQLASKLSGGQKRLFSFVLTLIGRPQVLFLDEPTAGMDTSTRQHFWTIVSRLKEQGITLLYSSHYIEEVEHTADRILVLHKGQLIRDTTPYAMRSEEQEKHFTIPVHFHSLLANSTLISQLEIKQDTLTFCTRQTNQVWQLLQAEGCTLDQIEVSNRSLLDSLFETTRN